MDMKGFVIPNNSEGIIKLMILALLKLINYTVSKTQVISLHDFFLYQRDFFCQRLIKLFLNKGDHDRFFFVYCALEFWNSMVETFCTFMENTEFVEVIGVGRYVLCLETYQESILQNFNV